MYTLFFNSLHVNQFVYSIMQATHNVWHRCCKMKAKSELPYGKTAENSKKTCSSHTRIRFLSTIHSITEKARCCTSETIHVNSEPAFRTALNHCIIILPQSCGMRSSSCGLELFTLCHWTASSQLSCASMVLLIIST